MEKLILFENQLNDLSTRLTSFENNAIEEGQKARADFNYLKSDLANLMADYYSLKKEVENKELNPPLFINPKLTKEEIEKLYYFAESFLEDIFENTSGNNNPEFDDVRFEIYNYNELHLEYVEVDTSDYIDEVIERIERDNAFSEFLHFIPLLSTDADKEIVNIFKSKDEAKFHFERLIALLTNELSNFRGYQSLNNLDIDNCQVELLYSKDLQIETITVEDWYSDVLKEQFDLSMFLSEIETDVLESLESDEDEDEDEDENNLDDSEK